MSDVQPVPPSVVLGPVALDPAAAAPFAYLPTDDGLAPLTGRVRDTATRAAAATGRLHLLTRGYLAPDAGDATRAESAAARDQLCTAVSTLAVRMRRDGVPPQRMLVVVKDAVRGVAPTAAESLAAREVMSDAVRCGIAAYYAAA